MKEEKSYKVTIFFSETYTVSAGSRREAQHKAYDSYKSSSCALIPDEYEVECLDEEDGE